MRKQILKVFVFCLCLCWAWGAVFISDAHALTEEQRLVSEVWRIVNRAYLDDTFNHQNWWFIRQRALQKSLGDRQDTYVAIQDMLSTLGDPFTRFLAPDQYRSLQTNTSGELTGVGLQIAQDEVSGDLRVIAPIEGSPADKAGILPRDRILKINGISTEGLTLDDAAERMRGPVGSIVTLNIQHEAEQPADVQLVRDRITLNPVYAELRPQDSGLTVGYIRLKQFNANATTEVAHSIQKFEEEGANAYILDLRNNPGGLLQAGIEIARLWLNEGTIVYTVNRQGILDSYEAVEHALTDDPLIVLVNQGTASASEILAGALQDNGRARLVGEKTFGKGLIQSLFTLSDGSGLAVTVAKYETPAHHDIHKLGIQPDVSVSTDLLMRDQFGTTSDPQYQAAVDLLDSYAVLAKAA
jgi:carboxyl-terminal processing protease